MKKRHISKKIIALGLAGALGVTTAFAALSVAPATTKLNVDGKAAQVEAYNIDNGNNFFKLRDLAEELDFGVTWDAATDTANIDTNAHYKPDPTQLITGNWAPATGPGFRLSSTRTPTRADMWSLTLITPPSFLTSRRPCLSIRSRI